MTVGGVNPFDTFDLLDARLAISEARLATAGAIIADVLAIPASLAEPAHVVAFLILTVAFVALARSARHRADSIFARSLAVTLAEGSEPTELARAA